MDRYFPLQNARFGYNENVTEMDEFFILIPARPTIGPKFAEEFIFALKTAVSQQVKSFVGGGPLKITWFWNTTPNSL